MQRWRRRVVGGGEKKATSSSAHTPRRLCAPERKQAVDGKHLSHGSEVIKSAISCTGTVCCFVRMNLENSKRGKQRICFFRPE